MKSLRFIYALLAFAIAFAGSLSASLGASRPVFFLMFSFGIGVMLLGALVGIACLLSWLWLLIAYEPSLDSVTPQKIKSRLLLLAIIITLDLVGYYGLKTIYHTNQETGQRISSPGT